MRLTLSDLLNNGTLLAELKSLELIKPSQIRNTMKLPSLLAALATTTVANGTVIILENNSLDSVAAYEMTDPDDSPIETAQSGSGSGDIQAGTIFGSVFQSFSTSVSETSFNHTSGSSGSFRAWGGPPGAASVYSWFSAKSLFDVTFSVDATTPYNLGLNSSVVVGWEGLLSAFTSFSLTKDGLPFLSEADAQAQNVSSEGLLEAGEYRLVAAYQFEGGGIRSEQIQETSQINLELVFGEALLELPVPVGAPVLNSLPELEEVPDMGSTFWLLLLGLGVVGVRGRK